MTCTCQKRTPCQIHQPNLDVPDVVEKHCVVIIVFSKWSNKSWYATLTIDAIQHDITDDLPTKQAAIRKRRVAPDRK